MSAEFASAYWRREHTFILIVKQKLNYVELDGHSTFRISLAWHSVKSWDEVTYLFGLQRLIWTDPDKVCYLATEENIIIDRLVTKHDQVI